MIFTFEYEIWKQELETLNHNASHTDCPKITKLHQKFPKTALKIKQVKMLFIFVVQKRSANWLFRVICRIGDLRKETAKIVVLFLLLC